MTDYDAILEELQARDQWLYWNASSDTPRKPLPTPAADYGAAWSDPDEWAANNLVGKLANVHPDMSDQTVETMQMFKELTGRDTVSADVKFEEPVRFENYATLIFACNRMPVLNDDTRGNWRRWLRIDFPNTFKPDAEGTRPKQELMAEMTTDEELQGLLARCVEEIQAWDQGRAWFPNAPTWEEARRRIRRAAEPVYDFAAACLDDSEGYETTDRVRRCYRAYAKAEGLPTMSREEFGRKLLNQTDFTIEKKQKRVDGHPTRVYDGVELTSRGEQCWPASPTVTTTATASSRRSAARRAERTVSSSCAMNTLAATAASATACLSGSPSVTE